MKKLVFIFFIMSFIVYYFTSAGKTPYDYFTRLSDSFLRGKYYLTENPPWLNELIPAGESRYYVAYPPFPAILAIPFRLVFKEKFEQQYLAYLLGSGIVVMTMLISWTIKKDNKLLVWSGLSAGFGTITWFMSASGSVWYLSQISGAFFLTTAIYESLNKKRPQIVGVFLGAAFLSRIEISLTFPLFLYFFWDKEKWLSNYFKMFIGGLPFVAFNFWYNFIRFGVVWDKAYTMIPGVLQESWYKDGIINIKNVPNHLKIIFWQLPNFSKKFPFVKPSWWGLAIWITTPAFIYSLFANIKEKVNQFSWISILLISLLIFSHGTTGFAQFGYRFAVDFYPILFLLTIKGVSRTGLRWHHWLLLLIGIFVNTWGVIFINKLGWVSY